MSTNSCMRKSTRKRIQQHRDDARRTETHLEEAAVISGTKLPRDAYIAELRREINAATTDEQRLKSMNELARVLWLGERDKKVMFDSPEAFDHDELHTAYHEGGHALLQMVFYGNLERVTIVPYFKKLEDFAKGKFVRGVCIDISHDLSGCDEHGWTVRSIEQAAIGVAAKIAENLFCTCRINPNSDCHDQRMLNEVFTDSIESRKGLSSATTVLLRRHRPQLDAIANALFERKTLTGPEVFEVMVKSGWSPVTDCDPRAFYEDFGVPQAVLEQRLLATHEQRKERRQPEEAA